MAVLGEQIEEEMGQSLLCLLGQLMCMFFENSLFLLLNFFFNNRLSFVKLAEKLLTTQKKT